MIACSLIAPTVLFLAASAATPPAAAAPNRPPKLVVLIVIDQFPAYIVPKLEKHFSAGGFRLLMERGAWFQQAYYTQAATLTGVGHATIATGGLPAGHGISGNDWYDRDKDREVYCVQDTDHQWVGGKGKPDEGTSPRNLTSTTFSDEWMIAQSFRPRVIGISLKDRGSILLVGRFGKAYWFDSNTGRFVSSTFYYGDGTLPAWAERFNAAKLADRHFHQTWNLLLPVEAYNAARDDRPYERPPKGLSRTFPHLIGEGLTSVGSDFYKAFSTAPQANEVTLDFARAAIAGEQLGRRGVTDILCLSLTSNDYCGHSFGPESLEYHDITLQTDRQLESFFHDIDRSVGLDHTLIVLTSDHGAAPTPEYLAEQGMAVGRLDPEQIARVADEALDKRFGPGDWPARFLNPGLFLRTEPMRHYDVPSAEAERVAAEAVGGMCGVAAVFTRSQLAAGDLPQSELARLAVATFHPSRSPDVIILQQPYWYLYKDMKKNAGMHGAPYPYDTHVPLLVFAPNVRPGKYTRRVQIHDVAPTVCQYLGVPPPTANEGSPLSEVTQN